MVYHGNTTKFRGIISCFFFSVQNKFLLFSFHKKESINSANVTPHYLTVRLDNAALRD